jgi:Tol biopolymer transport system component
MHARATLLALTLITFLTLVVGQANATFPGKNGRIAFVQGPDIFTMNPDGSDVKQLTNIGPDSGAFWQSWSPDGKQIAFSKVGPPDFLGQIWLMNADGSNQHALLAEPDFHNEGPSFSPDGSAVIFTRCRLDLPETCALYQMNVTGGGLTAITKYDLGIGEWRPKYSAYGSLEFQGTGIEGIGCALYLRADSLAGQRRITPAALSAATPEWSPDGRRIAFSTHCDNPQNEEIWVVNAESHLLQRLTRNGNDYFAGPHDFSPSWSPEGDAIVFQRVAPDLSSSSIVIMKADGSSSKTLLTLRPSARTNKSLDNRIHELGRGAAKRRLKEIEEGGVLPQWGVAPR